MRSDDTDRFSEPVVIVSAVVGGIVGAAALCLLGGMADANTSSGVSTLLVRLVAAVLWSGVFAIVAACVGGFVGFCGAGIISAIVERTYNPRHVLPALVVTGAVGVAAGIFGGIIGAGVGWERGLSWKSGLVFGGVTGLFGGCAAGPLVGSMLGPERAAAVRRVHEAFENSWAGVVVAVFVLPWVLLAFTSSFGPDARAVFVLYVILGVTTAAIAPLLNAWMQYEPVGRAVSIKKDVEMEGLNAWIDPFQAPDALVSRDDRVRYRQAGARALKKSASVVVGLSCGAVAGTAVGLNIDGRTGVIALTLVGWIAGGIVGAKLSRYIARVLGDVARVLADVIDTSMGYGGRARNVGMWVGVIIGVVGVAGFLRWGDAVPAFGLGSRLAPWIWAVGMPILGMRVGAWLSNKFGW